MKEKIRSYFKENYEQLKDAIINLTIEMCREKTVNVVSEKLSEHPYLKIRGEEYRVAEIVKREFDSLGIPYEEYSRMVGRPNVIGIVGSGKNSQKLLMAAHMDIVPAGDGWDTDPFEPAIKGDYIYGRGVLDNKGPLASCIIAAKVLKEVVGEENIAGQLQIAALADEEAEDPDGIDYGIGFLLEENLIAPTYAIIPDIGENMKKIDIAEKGRTVFKIVSKGKQAHGSTPERGVNAIYHIAKLISEIEKLKFEFEPHPLLIKPTLNLGEIHGGAAANIVPGECFIILDIRTLPGQTKEKVIAQLESLTDKVEGDFTVSVEAWSDPHKIDPDNALVNAIQENSEKYWGFKPEPFGMGGGTFAKTLNLKGIAAVGFGPGDDEAFHVANESVEIKQLVDFAEITCMVALDLLNN